MLDLNRKLSRGQFFDQVWYGGSPYAQWQARWEVNDNNSRRSAFIAGKPLPGYGTSGTNVFNPMIENFNQQYQDYLSLFDEKAANEAMAASIRAQQVSRVNDLREQSDARISKLKADSGTKVAAINAKAKSDSLKITRAGNAASAALRVLGDKAPKAPHAQMTRRGRRPGGARTTSAGYSRGSASTKGTNLSI